MSTAYYRVSITSAKTSFRKFKHKPLFSQTETLNLDKAGKNWRSALTPPAAPETQPVQRATKSHKYPPMGKFTLFIMASNSLSTSRSRRGESLCSNSSVSPCCSCDTKMLSPLPPPSLCLAHNSKQQMLNISAKTEMLLVKGRQQFPRDPFYPLKTVVIAVQES